MRSIRRAASRRRARHCSARLSRSHALDHLLQPRQRASKADCGQGNGVERGHGAGAIVVGVPEAGEHMFEHAVGRYADDIHDERSEVRDCHPRIAAIPAGVDDADEHENAEERLDALSDGEHEHEAAYDGLRRRQRSGPGVLNDALHERRRIRICPSSACNSEDAKSEGNGFPVDPSCGFAGAVEHAADAVENRPDSERERSVRLGERDGDKRQDDSGYQPNALRAACSINSAHQQNERKGNEREREHIGQQLPEHDKAPRESRKGKSDYRASKNKASVCAENPRDQRAHAEGENQHKHSNDHGVGAECDVVVEQRCDDGGCHMSGRRVKAARRSLVDERSRSKRGVRASVEEAANNREVNGGVIVVREGVGAVDRKKKHRNGHDERNADVQRSGFYQASRAFGIMRRRGAFRELGASDGARCFAGDRAYDVGDNPDRRSCSKQSDGGAGDGRLLKDDSKQNEEEQREGRRDDGSGESGDPSMRAPQRIQGRTVRQRLQSRQGQR